jgi:glutamine amidotransferase
MTDARSGQPLKVPHMGWNQVTPAHPHALWENIPRATRFYFVHSFFTRPDNNADVAATADYGTPFTAAIARGNVFAVQFHPEKSAQAGLNLYANFLRWDGQD